MTAIGKQAKQGQTMAKFDPLGTYKRAISAEVARQFGEHATWEFRHLDVCSRSRIRLEGDTRDLFVDTDYCDGQLVVTLAKD